MQHEDDILGFTHVTPTASMHVTRHGGRAKCLQRLIRLDMPVPTTVALPFDTVRDIARGQMPQIAAMLSYFGPDALLSVRPSSEDPDWGGPSAILNIGMSETQYEKIVKSAGEETANALYARFIQSYSVHVAHLDADDFDMPKSATRDDVDAALRVYEDEMDEPFPQDIEDQLKAVLRSRAQAWSGTSARLLREAKGAPADAGLGLVVQRMALGVGQGECGSGVIQFANSATGDPQITGRYLSQSQGRDALTEKASAIYLTKDPRGPSFEELCPDQFAELLRFGDLARLRLREEMQIEFTIENGALHILDAVRIGRSSQAAVRIAVALANDDIISKDEAIMRVTPSGLNDVLHRQIDPNAERDLVGVGIAASPGAASGRIVFTSNDAQASAARGEPCVLVRRETSPEDIRGMHVAQAILTVKGGITSHAAVIGRGIGLPCVVGASDLYVSRKKRVLQGADGREFKEGDYITIDGASGHILAGRVPLLEAANDEAVQTLLGWADDVRDIAIRANADTPAEAQMADRFAAEGIGLCRTEHMFFEGDRLTVMREMIFAESEKGRGAVLDRLLPMQRADFEKLFEIMQGKPVCIRLLDPPLHEFLPSDRAGLSALAAALNLPLSDVTARADDLREYNPMLGMRGVRLGIAMPEIYDMQARAIFEATVAAKEKGLVVSPEIMIPLVSAKREVELVKSRMDGVAAAVKAEQNTEFEYSIGVMVETPRAALRAGDIAFNADFLSFGTNDLTQMAYGLSRDDAGRFMSSYVHQGVYPEDPFHTLDTEGVGELLELGAGRARNSRSDIVLSICGEHGGSPSAIDFCRAAGFNYVSCSPFRVPGARLSAAQLVLRDNPEMIIRPPRGKYPMQG